MPDVVMQVHTWWHGQRVRPGAVLTVDEPTASRWESRGLASRLTPLEPDFERMSVSRLRAYAEEHGIETRGQRKSEIIAELRAWQTRSSS